MAAGKGGPILEQGGRGNGAGREAGFIKLLILIMQQFSVPLEIC